MKLLKLKNYYVDTSTWQSETTEQVLQQLQLEPKVILPSDNILESSRGTDRNVPDLSNIAHYVECISNEDIYIDTEVPTKSCNNGGPREGNIEEELSKMFENENKQINNKIQNSGFKERHILAKKRKRLEKRLIKLFGSSLDDVDTDFHKKITPTQIISNRRHSLLVSINISNGILGPLKTFNQERKSEIDLKTLHKATIQNLSYAEFTNVCDLVIPKIFSDSAKTKIEDCKNLSTATITDKPLLETTEKMKNRKTLPKKCNKSSLGTIDNTNRLPMACIDLTQDDSIGTDSPLTVSARIHVELKPEVDNSTSSEQAKTATSRSMPWLPPDSPAEPTRAEAVLPQINQQRPPLQKQKSLDRSGPVEKKQKVSHQTKKAQNAQVDKIKQAIMDDLANLSKKTPTIDSSARLQCHSSVYGGQQANSRSKVPSQNQPNALGVHIATVPQQNERVQIAALPHRNHGIQISAMPQQNNHAGNYQAIMYGRQQSQPNMSGGSCLVNSQKSQASHTLVSPAQQQNPVIPYPPQLLRLVKPTRPPLDYHQITNEICADKIYPHLQHFIQYLERSQIYHDSIKCFFNEVDLKNERHKFNEYCKSTVVIFGKNLIAELSTVNVVNFNLHEVLLRVSTKLALESGSPFTPLKALSYIKMLVERLESHCRSPFLKCLYISLKASVEKMEERAVVQQRITLAQLKQLEVQIMQYGAINNWLKVALSRLNNTHQYQQKKDHRNKSPPTYQQAVQNNDPLLNEINSFIANEPSTSTVTARVPAQISNPENLESNPENTNATVDNTTQVSSTNECDNNEESTKPPVKTETKIEISSDQVIDLTWIDDCDEQEIMDEVIEYKAFPFKVESPENTEDQSTDRETVSPADSGLGSPVAQQPSEDFKCLCGNRAIYVCACKTSMYCSRDCQIKDWVDHQRLCHKMQS